MSWFFEKEVFWKHWSALNSPSNQIQNISVRFDFLVTVALRIGLKAGGKKIGLDSEHLPTISLNFNHPFNKSKSQNENT